jgi:hypothetical protein
MTTTWNTIEVNGVETETWESIETTYETESRLWSGLSETTWTIQAKS